MAQRPEVSLSMAAATAAVVYAIHTNATPTNADIRSLPQGNADIENAERNATVIAAGVVGGISLLARDATVFIVGGIMVVAMAWWTRLANHTVPGTNSVLDNLGAVVTPQTVEGAPSSADDMATMPYSAFSDDYVS